MTATTDVVIVGGGVAGAATAFYLSRAGIDATIVERDGVAAHASGFAYGGLFPLDLPGPMAALSRRSYDLHETLAGEFAGAGLDAGWRRRPSITLALGADEAAQLRAGLDRADDAPDRGRWCGAGELRDAEPRLGAEVAAGVVHEDSAEVDPAALTRGLVELSGAPVRRSRAVGLIGSGERIAGVRLADGSIACTGVVLAAGPWLGAMAPWLGLRWRMTALKGEILRLRAGGPPLRASVGWRGNYVGSKPDGLVWAGTTEEPVDPAEPVSPTPGAERDIRRVLARMLPDIARAPVAAATACVRPVTRDGLLLLGPAPGLDGAWVAGGGGRKGILFGPGMGSAIAGLIAGAGSTVDLAPFDPGRSTA